MHTEGRSMLKTALKGLGFAAALALFAYLALVFFIPIMVWSVKWLWSDGVIEPLRINPYLGNAFGWLFAVPMFFSLAWLFRKKTRRRGAYAMVGLFVTASLFQYFMTKGQCTRVNELGQTEIYDGPCSDANTEDAQNDKKEAGKKKAGKRKAALSAAEARLREQFGRGLLSTGEFTEDFLARRENLNRVVWNNQQTGDPLVFYCPGPDGRIRVFVRDGVCPGGERHHKIDAATVELLYRRVRSTGQESRHKQSFLQEQQPEQATRGQARAELARQGRERVGAQTRSGMAQQEQERIQTEARGLQDRRSETARVVFVDSYYNDMANGFDFALRELNGVGVRFTEREVKIWPRRWRSEPLASVKSRTPRVFREGPFSIYIHGKNTLPRKLVDSHGYRERLTIPLSGYDEWLRGDEWIEVRLIGRDQNGHPQEITLAGAD